MVGDDTHRDVRLLGCTVLYAREGGDGLDHRGEDVGIVVGRLALYGHAETLESHSRVDDALGQGLQ